MAPEAQHPDLGVRQSELDGGRTDAMSNERTQAVQAVVDRMTSYQDGAPEGTVEKELRHALTETDVDLTDQEVAALVEAVESGEGRVSVSEVLG